MIKSVQNYKKLYQIEAEELDSLNKNTLKKIILQGNKNWNLYLTQKDNSCDFDILENIQVVEFKNQENMINFIKKLPKELFIDYSMQDNSFYVVNYEKD